MIAIVSAPIVGLVAAGWIVLQGDPFGFAGWGILGTGVAGLVWVSKRLTDGFVREIATRLDRVCFKLDDLRAEISSLRRELNGGS